jgi:hypothetical protein
MSKMDSEPPERLSSVGATGLERRLLRAATNEQPTRELSERMARGIGVALPAIGAGGAASLTAKSATAANQAAVSSSSLLPWILGRSRPRWPWAVGSWCVQRRPPRGHPPEPSRRKPHRQELHPRFRPPKQQYSTSLRKKRSMNQRRSRLQPQRRRVLATP